MMNETQIRSKTFNLSAKYFETKLNHLLSDTSTYVKLDHDPTEHIQTMNKFESS